MAHMYTTPSNAKAAATALAKKFPTLITAATSPRAPGLTPMYWAAVTMLPGAEMDEKTKVAIEDKARILDAEPVDEEPEEAPAPKKARKGKAPKVKAGKAPKAPKEARRNKTAEAFKLMSRKNGATAKELRDAFAWEPHTLRGFVSIKNNAERTNPVWNVRTVKGKSSEDTRYVIGGE